MSIRQNESMNEWVDLILEKTWLAGRSAGRDILLTPAAIAEDNPVFHLSLMMIATVLSMNYNGE